MNELQNLSINWANGWWFSAVFMTVNIFVLAYFPKHFKLRVLKQADFTNITQRVCTALSFILFQFNIWYSIFIPIQFESRTFFIGLIIFLIGMAGYILALINYATTQPDKPVTRGIYKLTRNPQQIMSIILWIGIGVCLNSWLIVGSSLAQLILSYPNFLAQEETCLRKYGQSYQEYLNRTKRYF